MLKILVILLTAASLSGCDWIFGSSKKKSQDPVVIETPEPPPVVIDDGDDGDGVDEPAPPLSLSGISPDTADFQGGETVVISGSGFQEGASVRLENFEHTLTATVSEVATESLSFVVPAYPGDLETDLTFSVVVTNPDEQTETLQYAFTYTNPDYAEGAFIDSLAEGLDYTSGAFSGITDRHGRFTYQVGEDVEFSINGWRLGSAPGGELLSPVDMTGDLSFSSPTANMVRLLIALDEDDDVKNGIKISEAVRAAAATWPVIDFDQSEAEFAVDVNVQLVLESAALADGKDPNSIGLVDYFKAVNHLSVDSLHCAYTGLYVAEDLDEGFVAVLAATALPLQFLGFPDDGSFAFLHLTERTTDPFTHTQISGMDISGGLSTKAYYLTDGLNESRSLISSSFSSIEVSNTETAQNYTLTKPEGRSYAPGVDVRWKFSSRQSSGPAAARIIELNIAENGSIYGFMVESGATLTIVGLTGMVNLETGSLWVQADSGVTTTGWAWLDTDQPPPVNEFELEHYGISAPRIMLYDWSDGASARIGDDIIYASDGSSSAFLGYGCRFY